MKLVIRSNEFNIAKLEIVAIHDEEEILWTIGSLDKLFLETKVKFDMFEHINAYWSQLKKPEQDKIFETYKSIRSLFDDVWDRNQLTMRLYNLVGELLDHHDLDDAKHWITFHSSIVIPDTNTFKLEYIPSPDKPGTRDQTYLRDDYISLITMATILRAMIPIWGEFIGRTRSEAGNNFKEYYAFKLINKSRLAVSEAMEKLRVYVECSSIAGKGKAASILGGVSSEDFAPWVLGLVVTRKVCVGDVRGIDPATTLITHIYNYVHQKVTGVDNSFNGPDRGIIKDKKFKELSQEGEKNLSRLEGYKEKQEIPAGDIVALEFSVQDPYKLAQMLAPTINTELVTSALHSADTLNHNRIYDSQIVLLQWVMKPVVPTRGISYLCKTTIVRLLAVCQAVLWHRGHKELAGLCTATASQNDIEFQSSGVDSRARIPKEISDELNKLFPHMKRPSGKQKTIKLTNQAVIAIDSVADMLSMFDWILTIEDKYLRELNNNTSQRRYSIPHNVKVLLANLVLQVAKRNY